MIHPMRRRFEVSVPATSANLGPGFDCMGIALRLYNDIELETGAPFEVVLEGEGTELLPTDRGNVVIAAIDKLLDEVGATRVPRDWRVRMVNRIPVGSGLGSSASAIVGGLVIGNALAQAFQPECAISTADVLRMAAEMEGHPDNVTPALLGGATLSCPDDIGTHNFSIPIPSHLHFVVAVPYFALYTEESRKVVPTSFSRSAAVFNSSQSARLILAMTTGNLAILRGGFGDKLHEPYREPLIPGYADVKRQALHAGALAVTLSGAGPSMLAWCDEEHKAWEAADEMTLAWREHGIACETHVFQPEANPTVVREVPVSQEA